MTAEHDYQPTGTEHLIGTDYEPISVHVASSAVLLAGSSRRKRRALRTNTLTLTASFGAGGGGGPTQKLLPRTDSRIEAWITSATEASPPVLFIAPNQADANAQGGGAAMIVGSDTTPVPVNTTDEVWVSAATGYPVTVSVWAINEVEE